MYIRRLLQSTTNGFEAFVLIYGYLPICSLYQLTDVFSSKVLKSQNNLSWIIPLCTEYRSTYLTEGELCWYAFIAPPQVLVFGVQYIHGYARGP